MTCLKVVYQLLVTVRYLSFMAGLALTILSILESDQDLVDMTYGLIAFVMAGIQFLFMVAFGCKHIKSFGEFLDESTYCLSLWIYIPEGAVIGLLVKHYLDTDREKLVIGALAAFSFALFVLLLIVCVRRVLRKDILEETQNNYGKLDKNMQGSQPRRKKQTPNKRHGNHDRGQQSQGIRNQQWTNGVQNGNDPVSRRAPPVMPKPQFSTGTPSLQQLVTSNSRPRDPLGRDRQRETPLHPHSDFTNGGASPFTSFDIYSGSYIGHSDYESQAPPSYFQGSYTGQPPANGVSHAPPLRYSGNAIGRYDNSNGYAPPLGVSSRMNGHINNYGGGRSFASPTGFTDIPPDY